MTSQPKSDVDGADAPAKAAADERQDSDTLAKSYRYLRLAMVGLLLCLVVAVIVQTKIRDGTFLSPSAPTTTRLPRRSSSAGSSASARA
jgi:hypothetical protein